MGQPSEEVTNWVKGRLNDVTEEGPISRIELWHAIEGEAGELLQNVKVQSDADPFDVAQEIWDAAETDSGTRMSGRMQRYVMIAYRPDSDMPDARRPFLMSGKATTDMLGGDTEPSTQTGHLGQLMRHDEKMHTLVMQLTEMTSGRLARDLEHERARRIKLEDRQMEAFETMQELLDRRHEREMERQQEAKKQHRHDELMALLLSMAPLVLAKALGPAGGMVAGNLPAAGARDEAIHQFLRGLTSEEAMKVFEVLPPSKQMALMEIYKAHKEEEESREEKEKEALASDNGQSETVN